MMSGVKGNPMDTTESTIVVNLESAEASFPSPEEIRTSSTSRSNGHPAIWSGGSPGRHGDAQQMDSERAIKGTRSHRRMITVFVVMALIVLLVIVPATVVSRNNQNAASANTPYYDDIVNFLVDNQISSVPDMNDPNSPQARAIEWLTEQDPANVPVPIASSIDGSYEAYMYMVRYVMAVNYFALGGTNWTNDLQFLMLDDVCDWNADVTTEDIFDRMGVFCANSPGQVNGELVNKPYEFRIVSNNLSGSIPSENGLLTSLQKFVLTDTDSVTGTIPTELCDLYILRSLHLSGNVLNGSIPRCINNMSNLQLLDLTYNQFSGSIPETLCQVPDMNELRLGFNKLTGEIPTCFGSLKSVTQLVLHENELEGNLPTDLCIMQDLMNLDVGSNALDGEIPSCLASIGLLEGLDLSDNFLTGSLPSDLSDSLMILSVSDNELVGDPSNLFNELVNLRVLLAANNNFTFSLSSIFVANTNSLKYLDLSGNRNISGMLPVHLLSHPTLETLDFSINALSGPLPEMTDDNTALEILALSHNALSGPVTSLLKLPQLIHLDLSDNQFTGSMDEIGGLQQLENLYLSENPFDAAPIPSSFEALRRLEILSLRNTNRNGTLIDPSKWVETVLLDFGWNNLTGPIPDSYGEIPFLQYLMLNDNSELGGDLPSSFQYLTELVGLFLDGTLIGVDAATTLLCTLPNFANDTIGADVFIVDCSTSSTCTDKCARCVCCDRSDTIPKCSDSYFDEFDTILDEAYQQSSNFYTIEETVQSTFEDHIRT